MDTYISVIIITVIITIIIIIIFDTDAKSYHLPKSLLVWQ